MNPNDIDNGILDVFGEIYSDERIDDNFEDNYRVLHKIRMDNFMELAGGLEFIQHALLRDLSILDADSQRSIENAIKSLTNNGEIKSISVKDLLNGIEMSASRLISALETNINGENSDITYLTNLIEEIETLYKTHAQEGPRKMELTSETRLEFSRLYQDAIKKFPTISFTTKPVDINHNWVVFYSKAKKELVKQMPEFTKLEKLNNVVSRINQYEQFSTNLEKVYKDITGNVDSNLSLHNELSVNQLFNFLGTLDKNSTSSLKNVAKFFGVDYAKIRRSSKVFTNQFIEGVDYKLTKGNKPKYTKQGLIKQVELYKVYVSYEQDYEDYLRETNEKWSNDDLESVLGEIAFLNLMSTSENKSSAIQASKAYITGRTEYEKIEALVNSISLKKSETTNKDVLHELDLQETFIKNYFLKQKAAPSAGGHFKRELDDAIESTSDFNILVSDAVSTNGPRNMFVALAYEKVKNHIAPETTLGEFYTMIASSPGVTEDLINSMKAQSGLQDDTKQLELGLDVETMEKREVFSYDPELPIFDKLDLIKRWTDLAKLNSTSITLGYVLDKRETTSTTRSGMLTERTSGASLRDDFSKVLKSTEYFGQFKTVRDFISSLGFDESEDVDASVQTSLLQLQIDTLSEMKDMLPAASDEDKAAIENIIIGLSQDYANTPLGYVFSTAKVALIDAKGDVEIAKAFDTALSNLKKSLDKRTQDIKKAQFTRKDDSGEQ
jgi:hypothetical protein